MTDQQEQKKIDWQGFPDRLRKEHHHGKADQKLRKADLVGKMLLIPTIQLSPPIKSRKPTPTATPTTSMIWINQWTMAETVGCGIISPTCAAHFAT